MKCFYHNDIDGRCAAAIVYKKFPDAIAIDFIEMDYSKYPDFTMVQDNEDVYIVDFSFNPDVMDKLFARTTDVTWIDHHITAKDYRYANQMQNGKPFDRYCDFTNKGPSGCELTWKCLFGDRCRTPEAVMLIGDYDTWRHAFAPTSLRFHEGLKLRNTSPTGDVFSNLLHTKQTTLSMVYEEDGTEDLVSEIIKDGLVALRYRDSYCNDMCRSFGFSTKIDDYSMCCCNLYKFGSQAFGDNMKKFDICCSFVFDGGRFIVSLYTDKTNIDVSAICKRFGGGGHKQAAGFVSSVFPFSERKER